MMTTFFRFARLTCCTLALSACSHNPPEAPPPPPDAVFKTNITDNNSKMFTYERIQQAPQAEFSGLPAEEDRRGGRGGPGGGPPGGGRGGPDGGQGDYLIQILEQKLAENSYCRDGYTIWEQVSSPGRFRIRGECKEGATDADRERYPNTSP